MKNIRRIFQAKSMQKQRNYLSKIKELNQIVFIYLFLPI